MKTGTIIFLAVLGALVVLGLLGGLYLRRRIRRFSRMAFGTPDLLAGLARVETEAETAPRSLSGCDSILMPQILRDFPDFDPDMAKTYARRALEEHLTGKQEVRIHRVVFARYSPSAAQKTIVMQASAQYREEGRLTQRRYELQYTYLLQGKYGDTAAAANCPNCGGAIGFGQKQCPYCGTRMAVLLPGAWKFTDIREC